MKNKKNLSLLATFLFILILCNGCEEKYTEGRLTKVSSGNTMFNVVFIDGCEYVSYKFGDNSSSVLTHKGNCKYCQESNKKMIQELLQNDTLK